MQLFDPYKKWTGRPTAYEDAEDLIKGCKAYFRWCEENPVQKKQLFSFQGAINEGVVDVPHAPTIAGLASFLGISQSTWYTYRKHPVFAHAVSQIEGFMHDFKFSHGAADVFNAGLIARDLGISDKQEVKTSENKELSDEELDARIREILDAQSNSDTQ